MAFVTIGTPASQPAAVAPATTTVLTVTVPGAIVAGNYLFVPVKYRGGTSATPQATAGWSLLGPVNAGTTFGIAIYYRKATGSEAASYQFTITGLQNMYCVGMAQYNNVDGTSPFVGTPTGQDNGSSASCTFPSVDTTGVPGATYVAFGAAAGTPSMTQDALLTERADSNSAFGSNNIAGTLADQMLATGGVSGTRIGTLSGAQRNIGFSLALRPADTTAPTLSSTTPANGATGVSVALGSISATFSEAVVASAGHVSVSGGVTGTLSGSGTSTLTLTLTSGALAYGTTYTVTLSSGITDAAGNPYVGGSFSFTTEAAPTPPTPPSAQAIYGAGLDLPTIAVWLVDPLTLRRRTLLIFESVELGRKLNDVGALTIRLPAQRVTAAQFPTDALLIVEDQARLAFDTFWLVTRTSDDLDAGLLTVEAVDATDLLRRRIVAYAAGSAQAAKTGALDNLMKAVVRENYVTPTDAARIVTGLSVAPDVSRSTTGTLRFARDVVLDVLRDLADLSRSLTIPLYFDLVARDIGVLEFVTWTQQRGVDRRAVGQRLLLGPQYGNLTGAIVTTDAADETTVLYAGGQGEEEARLIGTAQNTARIRARGRYGRVEAFYNGNTATTQAEIDAVAAVELQQRRARTTFQGTIQETLGTRYGRDFAWGDRVVAEVRGVSYDCLIETVVLRVEASGQLTRVADIRSES